MNRELRPGYEIPRLINGGWQLSAGHRERGGDPARSLLELQKLADAGLFAFDGADIYTGVEQLYGRLLQSRPNLGLRIHTKYVPDLQLLPRISKRDVREGIERSLGRLGVECLDLLQFHWWDFSIAGWLQTAAWLDELRQEGKIKHLAVTNFDSARLREILEQGIEVVAHQLQYSLLDRRAERGMVELCAEHDVHLLAYGTLAGGFLSERWLAEPVPSVPLANRSLVKYRLMIDELGGWEVFQELLRILDGIAQANAVSIANVATAWVLSRPQVASAVVGVSGCSHLQDNLRALSWVLGPEGESCLQRFFSEHSGAEGDVYSVERQVGGKHAVIMKTGLNQD